jgi:hypothetical protein
MSGQVFVRHDSPFTFRLEDIIAEQKFCG